MEENYLVVGGNKEDKINSKVINCSSFSEFIYNEIKNQGETVYIIDGISGKTLSYQNICDEASVLASSLLRLGILPGETIAVSCENRMNYPALMLASVFVGAVFNPINPAYGPDEIVHVLGLSKPRIVFCSAVTYDNIMLAVPRLRGVCHIVMFDDANLSNNSVPVTKYDQLLQSKPLEKRHQPKDDEITAILTSSGTTGLPKGVMLSYANLKFFMSRATNSTSKLTRDTVIMGLLPMFHGYGYGLLMSTIIVGSKFVLLPKFEEKLFLSTIQNYKITSLYMVPPLMVFLAKHPMVKQFDLSSVDLVACGAAPLSSEIVAEVQALMPKAEIRQAYGMTESTILMTITPLQCKIQGSVGKLVEGLQVKIIDTETGKPLRRGEAGEILVRGPCVMAGYCGDPKATRETIDSEGWLHTGDIGYVDTDGYFYIVDRLKELIKYKGYQVAPAELESVLLRMTGVRDAAVVGLPDLVAGELPIAYVVLQPNSTLTQDDILSYVNGKVSPQKKLREVRFIDVIPRNPSGKILRRVLKSSFKSNL